MAASVHWQPEGIRFPYRNWDTEFARAENMKYLEALLESFLHEHHSVPYDSGGGGGETVYDDPDVLGFENTILAVPDTPYYWFNITNMTIENIEPHTGTYSIQSYDFFELNQGSATLHPVPCEEGNLVSVEWWALATTPTAEQGVSIAFYDADDNFLDGEGYIVTRQAIADWTQFSHEFIMPAPANSAYFDFNYQITNNGPVDLALDGAPNYADDFVLTVSEVANVDVLHTYYEGFRFPNRKLGNIQAIEENVKFLYAQLEEWHHDHHVEELLET